MSHVTSPYLVTALSGAFLTCLRWPQLFPHPPHPPHHASFYYLPPPLQTHQVSSPAIIPPLRSRRVREGGGVGKSPRRRAVGGGSARRRRRGGGGGGRGSSGRSGGALASLPLACRSSEPTPSRRVAAGHPESKVSGRRTVWWCSERRGRGGEGSQTVDSGLQICRRKGKGNKLGEGRGESGLEKERTENFPMGWGWDEEGHMKITACGEEMYEIVLFIVFVDLFTVYLFIVLELWCLHNNECFPSPSARSSRKWRTKRWFCHCVGSAVWQVYNEWRKLQGWNIGLWGTGMLCNPVDGRGCSRFQTPMHTWL